jgi:chemotaxis signal transduction protein
MKDTTDWNEIEILPRTLGLSDASADARERRELLVMRACGREIGVFADEADCVSENLRLTPLPHAPRAVVGVVSVRGRIRTVLDPSVLLEAGESFQSVRGRGLEPEPAATEAAAERRRAHADACPRYVVSLRGDEQLALAVERIERIIEILTEDVQPLTQAAGVVRGITLQDSSTIVLLDPSRLFEAATQGTERRRNR